MARIDAASMHVGDVIGSERLLWMLLTVPRSLPDDDSSLVADTFCIDISSTTRREFRFVDQTYIRTNWDGLYWCPHR